MPALLHATDASAATARSLHPLTQWGWTVLHDLPWPGRRHARVDHLAVGPAGAFVVASTDDERALSGTTDSPFVQRAAAAADALGTVLPAHLADRLQIVVSVATLMPHEWRRPADVALGYDALVCSTATIADVLASVPAVWTDQQVTAAVADVRRGSRAAARAPHPRRELSVVSSRLRG